MTNAHQPGFDLAQIDGHELVQHQPRAQQIAYGRRILNSPQQPGHGREDKPKMLQGRREPSHKWQSVNSPQCHSLAINASTDQHGRDVERQVQAVAGLACGVDNVDAVFSIFTSTPEVAGFRLRDEDFGQHDGEGSHDLSRQQVLNFDVLDVT
jgi:hypothetical protein